MNYDLGISNVIGNLIQHEKDRLNEIELKLKIINAYNNDIKKNLELISLLMTIADRSLIIGQVSRALKYTAMLKNRVDIFIAEVNNYNDSLSKRFLK